MKVLVTGNRGYIGTILTQMLLDKGYEVVGYDTDYYEGVESNHPMQDLNQTIKDIRDIEINDIKDVEIIVHLAALSNDPLGEFNKKLTYDINYKSTIQLANIARERGVSRFIYSSSQSMYGVSKSGEELEEDSSEKTPITEYARTKWLAECELKNLCSEDFTVVCFRPSTVFGYSPMLRCDIVYNNLVASAYTTGKIEIKSDGTPWRPVVHVRDVCKAFIAGFEAPKSLVSNESYNVGIPDGNFTIRALAEAAQKVVPGSNLAFTGEHGSDSRTYQVSFKKILSDLKDYYKPSWDLLRGGKELVDNFNKLKFDEETFRGRSCNRLKQLQFIVETGKFNSQLRRI